jgi:hypothetical protein
MLKRRLHFETHRNVGKDKYVVKGPVGTRNQDLLFWQRAAAIKQTN